MSKRLLFICIICSFLFSVVLYFLQSHQSSLQTITYFPLNDSSSFMDTSTKLTPTDSKSIKWTTTSTTEEAMYLRHDVSLLFENGNFKGVQSKWRQDQSAINMEQYVPMDASVLLEAISFHHGEIHQSSDEITSIYKMTSGELYLDKQQKKIDENREILDVKEKINHRLKRDWEAMIANNHNELEKENYHLIPLVDLTNYEKEPLPGFSSSRSKEVIGKLWEGLYKNYILRLKEYQSQSVRHVMPLVMLSKDQSHLYVLFELNGKSETLFQQIKN